MGDAQYCGVVVFRRGWLCSGEFYWWQPTSDLGAAKNISEVEGVCWCWADISVLRWGEVIVKSSGEELVFTVMQEGVGQSSMNTLNQVGEKVSPWGPPLYNL